MKKIFHHAALIIAGILAGLLLSEATLTFLDVPRFYKSHTYPSQFSFNVENGTLFYTNKPSSDIVFVYDGNPRGYFGKENEIVHSTNSWGFRGKEFSFNKTGAIRIAFLGDSFTFGEGVKYEDTYPEKTAELLNRKYGAENISFESYNFGVGGYNAQQSLFLLENLVLKTSPDIIVLGYTLNDAEPELFYINPAGSVSRRHRETGIHEGLSDQNPPESLPNLRTARAAWKILKSSEISRQTANYYGSLYEPDNPGWKAAEESLKKLGGICEENQVQCFVVIFPVLYQLNDNYPFKELHKLVGNEINAGNYTHLADLFPYLKGRKDTELWVHPTDQHPNEIVHKIAAEALADAMASATRFEE